MTSQIRDSHFYVHDRAVIFWCPWQCNDRVVIFWYPRQYVPTVELGMLVASGFALGTRCALGLG
jgi:hypothetical protein